MLSSMYLAIFCVVVIMGNSVIPSKLYLDSSTYYNGLFTSTFSLNLKSPFDIKTYKEVFVFLSYLSQFH
jgi:hypothetical protein